MLFPSSVVEKLRSISNASMDYTAAIYGVTGTTREPGGISIPVETLIATVPCRLSQPPGVSPELIAADSPRNALVWTIAVDAGTTVPKQGRIVVTGTDHVGNAVNLDLRIIGHSGPRSNEAMRFITAEPLLSEGAE